MPDEKSRRVGPVSVSLVLFVALMTTMLVYYVVRVRPWTVGVDVTPAQLAELWSQVASRAAAAPAVAAEAGRLRGAAEALGRFQRSRLEEAVNAWQTSPALSAPNRNALEDAAEVGDALVAWARDEGGLGSADPCVNAEGFGTADLLLVGRITLAQAALLGGGSGLDDQRVLAVLRLATHMRRGQTLSGLVAGMRLALHVARAAERAEALQLLVDHPELAPAGHEIARTLNAEAFCLDARVQELLADDGGLPTTEAARADFPRAWVRVDAAFVEREREQLRYWLGHHLAAADERDLVATAQALAGLSAEEIPHSLLVRAAIEDHTPGVKLALEDLNAYTALVGS